MKTKKTSYLLWMIFLLVLLIFGGLLLWLGIRTGNGAGLWLVNVQKAFTAPIELAPFIV